MANGLLLATRHLQHRVDDDAGGLYQRVEAHARPAGLIPHHVGQGRHMDEAHAGGQFAGGDGVQPEVEDVVADVGARVIGDTRGDARLHQGAADGVEGQGGPVAHRAVLRDGLPAAQLPGIVRDGRIIHINRDALQLNFVDATAEAKGEHDVRAEGVQRGRELRLAAPVGGVQDDGPQDHAGDIGQGFGRQAHEPFGGIDGRAVVGREAGEEDAGGGRQFGFHGMSVVCFDWDFGGRDA